MNYLIEQKRAEFERICRERGVQRIELFGSATRPDFDPMRSDLDFLVTFQELGPDQYADAYFGLLEVGAGSGGFVRTAVARGWDVDATEISKSALDGLHAAGATVFAGDVAAAVPGSAESTRRRKRPAASKSRKSK